MFAAARGSERATTAHRFRRLHRRRSTRRQLRYESLPAAAPARAVSTAEKVLLRQVHRPHLLHHRHHHHHCHLPSLALLLLLQLLLLLLLLVCSDFCLLPLLYRYR